MVLARFLGRPDDAWATAPAWSGIDRTHSTKAVMLSGSDLWPNGARDFRVALARGIIAALVWRSKLRDESEGVFLPEQGRQACD